MADAPAHDSDVLIHRHALCESEDIGTGTRIWAFVHVLPGAVIGRDCNVCDHVFIENDVIVGDRVTIKSGVQLWNGLRVGDDVFIGPNASFSNDKFPRSKQHLKSPEQTHIATGASIGAAAVVLPGLKIGAHAMVGAGAVVTHDVPPKAIVSGNPARIVGYVDAQRRVSRDEGRRDPSPGDLAVRGARLQRLKLVEDLRGRLTVGQVDTDLPFVPQRYFMVFDVPGKDVRGEHAHRQCAQFLICARGSVTVVVDDGATSEEIVLDRPNLGLYVPPMVWAVQYRYSSDALLLVLASHAYDADDYIRDYTEFLAAAREIG
jgi:UDP-2-acetamido-3-amino-2,3-dideoxy-glucuronate N-acetyltransferase